MPFCVKAPATAFISLKTAAAPQGRRTKRSRSCFPPRQWLTLVLTEQRHQQRLQDWCLHWLYVTLTGIWESHKAVFTQASPLLNPFVAPEAFHNEHSSKATLNLLKQNLFIRKLGWRSEIIIIGGYLQQEVEKEWYTVVVSGMYFIASHQNTADREKNWHFHASVYFMLQCNQHMHFPTVKTILGFPFNTQKWRWRRTAWET